MLKYLRLILFPLSLIYGLIIIIRNWCYDLGLLQSVQFDLPVICVGNLAVGGSGKTPVTEYLVNLLAGKKIAILSRGYGRQTTGFLLADETSTASSIGDEPMQYYHKFPQVTVAVCEDRVKGIRLLEKDHDLVILDDAYQHRHVKAGLYILLFEYASMFRLQWMLPTGNLREPFSGYRRADAILITKSPIEITVDKKSYILNKFADAYKPRVHFAVINYASYKPVFSSSRYKTAALVKDTTVFLLTGIANPFPLVEQLQTQFRRVLPHRFPDHHRFSMAEISGLVEAFRKDSAVDKCIITTEKDAQRLIDADIIELLVDLPVFYLPIAVQMQAADQDRFNNKIIDYVSKRTRNRTIY